MEESILFENTGGMNYRTISAESQRSWLQPKYLENIADHFNPSFNAKSRRSSKETATFNIIATMLDGTVLSLPYAFAKCGVITGMILLIFVASATYISLINITTLVIII